MFCVHIQVIQKRHVENDKNFNESKNKVIASHKKCCVGLPYRVIHFESQNFKN